ncbi:hypothetical protein DL96DRAFT_1704525 [Flagelloscypha sp. PMI_526]|nr:hypothetical protein DL96DRAFT_1704525 [Flagelloscypha sp. PMI_526]
MSTKRLTLAEQIAELDDVAPVDFDPDSIPKEHSDNDEEGDVSASPNREHYVDVGPSTMQKMQDISISDPRYDGVKVSRKQLEQDLSEDENESQDSEDDEGSDELEGPNTSREDLNSSEEEKEERLDDLTVALRKKREEDRRKGQAVSAQLTLWNTLMDARIRAQKISVAASRLPEKDLLATLREEPECQASLKRMLEETVRLSDEIEELQESLLPDDVSAPPRKKRRVELDTIPDFETQLVIATAAHSAFEAAYHPHLIQTLSKWSSKIQAVAPSVLLPSNRNAFSSSKSSTSIKSAVDQISERNPTIKETKMKRLGVKVEDPELFDDTDFYQQMLRDVIDTNGEGGWCCKGRKIRYEVHEKLQNFMVPIPAHGGWHEEQIDELFVSLLGKGSSVELNAESEVVVDLYATWDVKSFISKMTCFTNSGMSKFEVRCMSGCDPPQPTFIRFPTCSLPLTSIVDATVFPLPKHWFALNIVFPFRWPVSMSTSDRPSPPGTDGGGIRAISQALMVREMMHRVEIDHRLSSPVRVCGHFDMICGSGFGGLLAIMCGILKMTGDELVHEFVTLCKVVFLEGLDTAQRTQVLENEIKRLIRTYSTCGEERKMIAEDDTCRTFVCAAAFHNTSHPRLFRNYPSRANPSINCMLWEAACATLVMPDLFNPITIRDAHLQETFVGGALRWNNPTDVLTMEAANVFKDRSITSIISIGSGHPGYMSLSKGLTELFPRIALDCERTADDMERRFGNAPEAFWRLSVEQGLQNLEVDLSNLDALVSHTNSYLQGARTTRNIDTLLQDLIRRPERIPVDRISGMAPVVSELLHRKVCPSPTQYFIERRSVLQNLEGYFFSHRTSCRIGVLYGIGGGGKSQIGLQFIQLNRNRFSDVFFIDASSKYTLETDLKAIAVGAADKPTAEDGLRILRTTKEEWLLFLDNADDTTLDLRPYIIWSHGNVLITTRNREVRLHAPECSIWVDKLEVEEAKELLLSGVAISESSEAASIAYKIVQELGCLALAVNQARGFLAQDICTLSEYLPIYMRNRKRLLEDKTIQSTDDYEHTVYTTWTISFNRLSSDAAFLLELLCFMHHNSIPSRLFEDAWKAYENATENAVPTTLMTFLSSFKAMDSAWDILQFRKLIREILSFSLMEFDASNHIFSLHPLVQQWAQSQSRNPQETIRLTQTLLCLATPSGESQQDYITRLSLLPHVRESTRTGLCVHSTFMSLAGLVYHTGGLFRESCQLFERLVSELQDCIGPEHPNTLRGMNNLGVIYSKLGRYQDALDLYERVLPLETRILGKEHPNTLSTMNDLAVNYVCLGQHQDALKLLEQVLALRTRTLGEKHPHTLQSMNSLAGTYSRLSQYQDALRLKEQVLVLMTQTLGKEHPDTLTSMNNLASTYSSLGRHQDALKLIERALTVETQILGEEHPNTLTSMSNLASAYAELDQPQEALKLEERVLALSAKTLGEEHPHTLTRMNNIASTYSVLGQHRDALEVKERVLALSTRILGKEHPSTLHNMSNLAATYLVLGRRQDALNLHEQVLPLMVRNLGDDHPSTLAGTGNLACIYLCFGRYQDALKLLEQNLAMRRRILGERHPDTLMSMGTVADTYSRMGQPQTALKLWEQVLALKTEIVGKEHPHTLAIMNHLVTTYSKLGRHQDALDLNKQTLALRTQIQGKEHPDTLICMGRVAAAYSRFGQPQMSLELWEQVQPLITRVLGEEHPVTLETMDNLAVTYASLGRHQDALKLQERNLVLLTQLLGEDHPRTITSVSNLAATYTSLGRSSEALKFHERALNARTRVQGPEHPGTIAYAKWVQDLRDNTTLI